MLDRADVDTDQIIPKQFLKRVERTGFGEFLFYDWAQGARLGPARRTRSSPPARTSAAAPAASTRRGRCRTTASGRSSSASFADIFFSNCTKIGLLPVVLPEDEVRALMAAGEAEVDLEALEVRFDGRAVPFELDAERRRRLLEGLDDIALTLQQEDAIARLRARPRARRAACTHGAVALTRHSEYGRQVAGGYADAAATDAVRRTACCADVAGAPARRT